jgi:hypothetical protein
MLLRFSILLTLFGCFSSDHFQSDDIATFAFNAMRTGSYKTSSPLKELDQLKTLYPEWGKQALKHVPLYLAKKELLIFGTNSSELVAWDLAANKKAWSVTLASDLLSTPVYWRMQKKIYTLTQMNETRFQATAIDLNGQIISTTELDLQKLYQRLGFHLKKSQLSQVVARTALGLNSLNKTPYIYFALATARNPFDAENADFYGMVQGATGLLLGVYLSSQDGSFLAQEPLLFSPSQLSSHSNKMTAFNTGIYNAGGTAALLPDNTLLVATGNGPFYPEDNNFGCSLIRLRGDSFTPIKKNGVASYLSIDDSNSQECFSSNNELSSSYASVIQTGKDTFLGVITSKFADMYLFDPMDLAQHNQNKKIVFKSEEFFKSMGTPHYAGASLFQHKGKTHAILHHNGRHKQKSYPPLYGTEKQRKEFQRLGYQQGDCIGLLNKKGEAKDQINFYYTGEHLDDFLIGDQRIEKFVSDTSLKSLRKLFPKLQASTVYNYKTPYQKKFSLGYSVKSKEVGLGEIHLKAKIAEGSTFRGFSLQRDDELRRSRFYSFQIVQKGIVSYLKAEKGCEDYPQDNYQALYLYHKEPIDLDLGFKIHSLQLHPSLEVKVDWVYQGLENEKVDKNSLVTAYNGQKAVTIFNAINDQEESFIYILNTMTGKLVHKYPIKGKTHFSAAIFIDRGIIVPTIDNGLVFLAF